MPGDRAQLGREPGHDEFEPSTWVMIREGFTDDRVAYAGAIAAVHAQTRRFAAGMADVRRAAGTEPADATAAATRCWTSRAGRLGRSSTSSSPRRVGRRWRTSRAGPRSRCRWALRARAADRCAADGARRDGLVATGRSTGSCRPVGRPAPAAVGRVTGKDLEQVPRGAARAGRVGEGRRDRSATA